MLKRNKPKKEKVANKRNVKSDRSGEREGGRGGREIESERKTERENECIKEKKVKKRKK